MNIVNSFSEHAHTSILLRVAPQRQQDDGRRLGPCDLFKCLDSLICQETTFKDCWIHCLQPFINPIKVKKNAVFWHVMPRGSCKN
jgi:hypothetical protein